MKTLFIDIDEDRRNSALREAGRDKAFVAGNEAW